jgi:hypothetical protein
LRASSAEEYAPAFDDGLDFLFLFRGELHGHG